jgi:hypothetical protein
VIQMARGIGQQHQRPDPARRDAEQEQRDTQCGGKRQEAQLKVHGQVLSDRR